MESPKLTSLGVRPRIVELFGSKVVYWVHHPEKKIEIVMVHGFRGNHVGLENFIERLPNFRIIVADLPGHGFSSPMPNLSHSVVGLSEFVVAFMAALRINKPILMGHSFGSIVAGHIAATKPSVISKLILINPIAISPRAGINWPATKFVEVYYWLGIHLPEKPGYAVIKSKTFNRMMSLTLARSHDSKIRKRIYEHHLNDLKFSEYRHVISQSFRDSISKTVMNDAPHIKAPTLLIAGSQDAIVPTIAQRRLQVAIAGSKLVIIPKVGHLVHLETPDAAAEAIINFIG